MPLVVVPYEEIAKLIALILERYNGQFGVPGGALSVEDMNYGFVATREGYKNCLKLDTVASGDALVLKIYVEYILSEKPYISPFRLENIDGEVGDPAKVYIALAKLPREIFPALSKYLHNAEGIFQFTSSTFDGSVVTVERVGGTAGTVVLEILTGSGDGQYVAATITFNDGEGGSKSADTNIVSEEQVELVIASGDATLGSPTFATVLFGYAPPQDPIVSWTETPQDVTVDNVGDFFDVMAIRNDTEGELIVDVEIVAAGDFLGTFQMTFADGETYAGLSVEATELPMTYELTIQLAGGYQIGEIQTVNGTVTQNVAGNPGVLSFASPTGFCHSVTLNRTGGSDGYAAVMIGFNDSDASFGPVEWNDGDGDPKTANICPVSMYAEVSLYLFSADGATIDEDNDSMSITSNGSIEFTAASSPCNQAAVVRHAPAGGPASVQIWQNLEEMFGTISWDDGESGEKLFNACPYQESSGDATFNLQEISGAPPGEQLTMLITAEEEPPVSNSQWVHRFDYLVDGSVISPPNIATSVYESNFAVYSANEHTGSRVANDFIYFEFGMTLPELDFSYSINPTIEAHGDVAYGLFGQSTSQISLLYDHLEEEWRFASSVFTEFNVALPSKPTRMGVLFQASTKKTWVNFDGVYRDSAGGVTGVPSASNFTCQSPDIGYNDYPELLFSVASDGLAAQTTGQKVILDLATLSENIEYLPAGATPWDEVVEIPQTLGWGEPTVDGWFGAGTFDGIFPEDGFFGPVPTDISMLRAIRKYGMSTNEAFAGLIDATNNQWITKTSGKWTAAFRIDIKQPTFGSFARVVVGFGDDQVDLNNFYNYPAIQAGVYFGRGGEGLGNPGELSRFGRDGNFDNEVSPAASDQVAYVQLFMDIDAGECRVHYTYGNSPQPPAGPISALPLISNARGTGPMGIRAYLIPWDSADITVFPYVTADAISDQSWTAPANEYKPFAETAQWFEIAYEPETKGPNIVLSNNNLTASSTSSPSQFALGANTVAGDFAVYLEQKWTSVGNSQSFGFSDMSGNGGFRLNYAAFGNPTFTMYSPSGGALTQPGPDLGDTFDKTLGFAIRVNGGSGRVWIRHDDGAWIGGGDPETDTDPTITFVVSGSPMTFYSQMDGSFGSGSSVTVATLNFEYPEPAGFSPMSVYA